MVPPRPAAPASIPTTAATLPTVSATPAPAPGAPPGLPATPAAALTQMVPEAMARQNSVAPLLASLAAIVARPGAVPEPVLRAAVQVLGQRVQLPPTGPTGDLIKGAIEKSGIFLEAGLARGQAPAQDMKASLAGLRSTLATWLGGNPPPVGSVQQAAPPLRGVPLRAEPVELPPLPEAAREIPRALHQQADAALSRVKLMQLASLPDADPARLGQPELRLEVPFLVGSELVMAQFQVSRDAARRRSDGKRGWTMRFAMNFSGAGEVSAEIGLIGRSVSVSLWAADAEMVRRLEAALPELAPALAALGLEPGVVRIRSAPPEPEAQPAGRYLDSLT
jgi:hypothetical protein